METAVVVLIVLASVIAFLALLILIFTIRFHNKAFACKIYTRPEFVNTLDMYPGLARQRIEYTGNKGQKLVGHWYTVGDNQHAVMVFAHGFGCGGHNVHMSVINYFANHGYAVLAYDATGCDESDSIDVGTFPQGVADMDYALRQAKASQYGSLPIVTMGHSWGGYSVGSALEYHPDVVAVAMMAAVNSSGDLVVGGLSKKMGKMAHMFAPFLRVAEWLKSGKYCRSSCVRGMAKSSATCIVLHSADDDTVPKPFSYDVIYKYHKNRPNTVFVPLEDRGHGFVFNTQGTRDYYIELGSIGSCYFSRNGVAQPIEKLDVDKSRYFEIDVEFFDNILAIYEDAIAKVAK